jgi:hypothetical protein
VERVLVWRDENGDGQTGAAEVLYDASWNPIADGATTRTLTVETNNALAAGRTYRLHLQFNKPMRIDDGTGQAGNWPGQDFALQPVVEFVSPGIPEDSLFSAEVSPVGDGWHSIPPAAQSPGYARYARDTWEGRFHLEGQIPGNYSESVMLRVGVQDLYGFDLDADPVTVAEWDSGWKSFEGPDGADGFGGADESHTLSFTSFLPNTVRDWRVFRD